MGDLTTRDERKTSINIVTKSLMKSSYWEENYLGLMKYIPL
jgi:hypothetical protein